MIQEAALASRATGARSLHVLERNWGAGAGWFLLLLAWIVLRNLLEGIFERAHQLGFDWRGDVSFGMFFLHFPVFYLAVFITLLVWLHLLSGRSIAGVARALAIGFALILVAPIIDALVSHGRGYDLRYLLGLGTVMWRFWDPLHPQAEVSPGQRVEIALACVSAAAYVFVARRAPVAPRRRGLRGLVLAVIAAAGTFVILALLGAWPALFAQLSTGRPLAEAYAFVYRGTGLIADESRRLAIIMIRPLLVLLPIALWRSDPRRFAGVLRGLGWTRLLHYSGLAPAGAFAGWLVYRDQLRTAFTNPVDAAAVVVIWLAFVAAYLAARCWNDVHDLAADRLNEPGRPLARGLLDPAAASRAGNAAALAAIFLALLVSYSVMLLMLACLILAWLYSSPPVRLKRWPGVATLTLAILSLISFAGGYALFAQEMTPLVLPRRLSLYIVIGITLAFVAKDLKDAPGDRATGVSTLATLLGERRARWLAAILVAVAYLIAGLFLPLGGLFYLLSAIWALGSAAMVLRRRRPDNVLLAAFLVFAALVLVFLAQRPAILRDRLPESLQIHARTRAIEETLRAETLRAETLRAETLRRETLRAETHATNESGLGGSWHEDPSLVSALDDLVGATKPRNSIAKSTATAATNAADISPDFEERWRWDRAQVASPALAIADLTQLIALRPLFAVYRDRLISALHLAGRDRDAQSAAGEALAQLIRPGDFLRQRAALAIADGAAAAPGQSRDRVLNDLRGAFLFGQKRSLVWVLWGDALQAGGKCAESVRAYREALRLEPDDADAWNGLGQAQFCLHNLGESLAAFDQALELRPDDPLIHNNIGVALRETGRLDAALTQFQRAHALSPQMFEPILNLARTYEAMGRLDEARVWYDQAAALERGAASGAR